MANIYYEVDGFGGPPPTGFAGRGRGNLRAGMAAIQPDSQAHWRSARYSQLDPSEKGAVSFFLGQTQAKLFAHDFFRVSRFVHFDAYLAYHERPRQRTRPDFIGFYGRHVALGVEAKGRSLGSNRPIATKAKKQASSLPVTTGHPVSRRTCTSPISIMIRGVHTWRTHRIGDACRSSIRRARRSCTTCPSSTPSVHGSHRPADWSRPTAHICVPTLRNWAFLGDDTVAVELGPSWAEAESQ